MDCEGGGGEVAGVDEDVGAPALVMCEVEVMDKMVCLGWGFLIWWYEDVFLSWCG